MATRLAHRLTDARPRLPRLDQQSALQLIAGLVALAVMLPLLWLVLIHSQADRPILLS